MRSYSPWRGARSRPGAALLVLVTFSAVGLAACNPAGGDDNGDGEGGATFVIARTGDLDQLDPAKATAFQTVETLNLVYEQLVHVDENGEFQGELAQDWTVSPDGTKITFRLRTGVSFHNGEAFTAADAKASLDRVLDPETASVAASYLANVAAIDAVDDATLEITLNQPDTGLLTALSYTGTSILDEADAARGTFGAEANGTGPFHLESWQQGEKVTLAAHGDYWGEAPKLGTVEFRVIPDEASILSGMKAGSFHLGRITDPSVARQADPQTLQVISQPTLSYHVLMLNGARGPLREQAARQAIACAVDRQEVVNTATFGHGTVTGPITSPSYQVDPLAGLPCTPPDVNAATDLLAEAGYPDGFTLKTIVMLGEYATATGIAQSLAAQLAKIGVTLDLDQQQTGVYVDRWLKADFDAAVALNSGSFDPYLMYNRYFTAKGSLVKPAGLADPRLDELLAAGNATTDLAERERVFGDLQRRMLEISPWVWLFTNEVTYVLAENVTGFTATPTESLEYLRVTDLS